MNKGTNLFKFDYTVVINFINYENGNISYKVTEIRVEDNKAVDIEVIHNSQKHED